MLLRSGQWDLRAEARVQTLTVVFRSLASLVVWFIAVVWILQVLGIALGPLIAGAGIVGVALGFGAQNVVRDFLAGFFLIVEDQFGVGDIVDLSPDVAGTVEKITMRATRLRDVNGTVWHMPNGQILRAGNKSQEWARALDRPRGRARLGPRAGPARDRPDRGGDGHRPRVELSDPGTAGGVGRRGAEPDGGHHPAGGQDPAGRAVRRHAGAPSAAERGARRGRDRHATAAAPPARATNNMKRILTFAVCVRDQVAM